MPAHPGSFQQFLRRVHRRQVALYVLERSGLGVLGGCAAGLPLVGIAILQGRPGWLLAVAALGAGALAGLLWGILTRPDLMMAATEADRQLDWADLLSSALAVLNNSAKDHWAMAVIAAADARVRTASPSTILLNRFGARAWGGIGLAAALVLVLGLMPVYSTTLRAGSDRESVVNPLSPLNSDESPYSADTRRLSRRTADQAEPNDTHGSHMDDPTTGADASAKLRKSADANDPTSAEDATATDSNGRGQSQSDPKNLTGPHPSQAATAAKAHLIPGRPSGGVGVSAKSPHTGAAASGQIAGLNPASASAPPWQSTQWPADVQRARQSLSSGQIPDAYRNLVRDYFERR